MMNVAQIWSVIGVLGASLIGLVTAMFWLVTIQGARISEGFAGVRNEFTSVRNEFAAAFNGLRNEMNARFDHVESRFERIETRLDRVEKIDREVHALTLKVFGDEPRSP